MKKLIAAIICISLFAGCKKDTKDNIASSLKNGLVAYYPFNGNANDESGNGNNGAVSGATLTSDRKGKENSAYQFGGFYNSNFIKINNSPSLKFTDQFSFSGWVKINNKNGMDGFGNFSTSSPTLTQHCLFSKDWDQEFLRGSVFFESSQLSPGFAAGLTNDNGIMFKGSSLTENVWFHVTFTYLDNEFKIYIDGKLAANKTGSLNFTSTNLRDLYLGRFSSFWYPLDGVLDEIRFYNRALTQEEITWLANN